MDFLTAFDISTSGMSVEKLRMETVARNLANANTTAHPGTETYQALRVVSTPKTSFNQVMQQALGNTSNGNPVMQGVEVKGVEAAHAEPRLVFEPSHPHADKQGYVAYPNINPVTEMLHLIEASRAFEANVQAFNAAKTMADRALQIGGNKS